MKIVRDMNAWKGKWALITGGSAGIGTAFAERLAREGMNLVLTARRAERLEEIAAKLRSWRGVQIEIFPADLEHYEDREELFAFTQSRGIAVEMLVNNAGFGAYGEFRQIPLERQIAMVRLNCEAVVHLTGLYVPSMVERRSGEVIIVASTAGYQPTPYLGTYGATKGFDLLLAESLSEELAPYGVRAVAISPGPTKSEFQTVAGSPSLGDKHYATAEDVVDATLRGLVGNKQSVIHTAKYQLMIGMQRLVPRRFVTGMVARMLKPRGR